MVGRGFRLHPGVSVPSSLGREMQHETSLGRVLGRVYLSFSALFVGQGDATLEQALACALWARFSALFVGQGDATS